MKRPSLICSIALGALLASTFVHAQAVPELTEVAFLRYADFTEVDNVVLNAQVPESSMILYENTPESSVWYTPMATRTTSEGVHQIWYLRFDYDEAKKNRVDQRTLALGEIRNNQWSLVEVQATAPCWGGVNNVVLERDSSDEADTFSPHQIVTDPSGGLLNLYWSKPPGGNPGVLRATASSSGTQWTKVAGVVASEALDTFTVARDGNGYRMYQTALKAASKPYPDNFPGQKRVITLRYSNDASAWTSQNISAPMLQPDPGIEDAATEFYAFKAFRYGSGYGGLLWKYYADPAMPNEHSSTYKYELVTSADGITWERPFRDTETGLFSYADPINYAGRFSFVAQYQRNMVLRGWVAGRMVAAQGDGGTLRTKAFYFPPNGIDVNADTSNGGWIDVTACDQDGNSIVGWSPVRIQNDNGTKLPLPSSHYLWRRREGIWLQRALTGQGTHGPPIFPSV
jgi:hypothetical protein